MSQPFALEQWLFVFHCLCAMASEAKVSVPFVPHHFQNFLSPVY